MNESREVTNRSIFGVTIYYILLVGGALISLFPFYWMFVIASSKHTAAFQNPPKLIPGMELWKNFSTVLDRIPFFNSLLNSFIIASLITVSVLFFCTLAGYAFAKYEFPGRNFLFIFVIGTLLVPQQLSILPNYILMAELSWIDSYKAVVVPGMVTAFGIFWMRQYISSAVHTELLESGRIDGASHFRVFWNIAVPMITPAIATLGIFTFLQSWNDFLWPLIVLKSADNHTIQISLQQLFTVRQGLDYGMILAGTFAATLPLLIVFLLFSRWFISGLTQGAVKG